jgi:hypothetical protein
MATGEKIENLLGTKYYYYRNKVNGKEAIACIEYVISFNCYSTAYLRYGFANSAKGIICLDISSLMLIILNQGSDYHFTTR